jgi:hypothetical protein
MTATAEMGFEDHLVALCAFLQTQKHLGIRIELDALKAASKPDELGITSLSVILLLVNYMEVSGMSSEQFNPEWVSSLDSIEGIVSVFRELNREKCKRVTE